ncbi:MAG: efflux RND transporter periplasmic adaptor subunit [Kiritimatiellae bacterium]|nr:efflux RND transporter periplasmic adaptor subunit [Kiritimatiellia bacterium]
MRNVFIGFAALALVVGCAREEQKPQYRTAKIVRTDIVSTVEATGTVTPIKKVEVGAQVNGRVIKLFVDYNSVVTNGQVVALIDPLVYEANYKSAVAQLHVAEANVEVRKAALASAQAELILAEKTFARKSTLAEKSLASAADLDAATEVLDRAKAAVEQAKANLKSAESSVEQARASSQKAEADLGYCTIKSPVDGVVITRSVDEGQTVVSSMNAVPLLKIAEDLKTIWVEANVPEADVGSIHEGQRVTFTADAYRDKFEGVVKQVRISATTTNNVVTYPIIVEAANPGEKLFPGMTTTITIETDRADDTLAVTSAAFRFRPSDKVTELKGKKVWLMKDGDIEARAIEAGVADASFTQILNADDLEGCEVAIGYQTAGAAKAAKETSNPFMPKPPQHNKNRGTAPAPKQ